MLRALATAAALLALACGSEAPAPPAPAPPPPPPPKNLLVITVDTLRADALGVYGQRLATSPRIDAMAAEGTLFEQASSSAPNTFPSHSTLFTGKQPYAHGVRANAGYVLPAENLTLAEILSSHGYRTAAEVAAPVLKRSKQLDQGFESYRDPDAVSSVVERIGESKQGPLITGERKADEISRYGIEFLREHVDEPFFLWLHYFDPHALFDAPEPFRSEIPGNPYLAEVRFTDHEVGRVLDELERLGLRERTLVVLTADHGEGRGEHGEETHSFFVYQTTMRVPLIFWGAEAIPRGQRVSALVRLVDVMPTILDLLGIDPPPLQGSSLRPLLQEPAADPELLAYGESIEPFTAFGCDPLRFVRRGRWKYVHKLEPELFDLEVDPGEQHNLAEQRPELVKRLRGELETLLATAPAPPSGAVEALDAQSLAELRALGYVGGTPSGERDLDDPTLHGPDPVSRTEDMNLLAEAWGQFFRGENEAALLGFRTVWERNPDSLAVLYGLANTLMRMGKQEELIPLLRRALELDPENVEYRLSLALQLRDRGEKEEAESLLRQVIALDPCSVTARLHLSELLREAQRYREQLEVLGEGDDACDDSVTVRNALAYALATSPLEELRDGARALELARVAVDETGGQHPDYLDTLAAACAEVGDFACAVAEQKRALALLEGVELPPGMREPFEEHLAAYERGEPMRQP